MKGIFSYFLFFSLIYFAIPVLGLAGLYNPPARGPQQCGPTATFADCHLTTPPCGGSMIYCPAENFKAFF
jgi:hypothetical protein